MDQKSILAVGNALYVASSQARIPSKTIAVASGVDID
jgi:hypothetical protein